ncbi:MAG: phosphoenolpyruvate carboxykinase (ATP), partial [Calditrichaeota bacterium]|nr:phosphoenolpyruvate carboxykinase (ATP) [Calditrichota bacterium]
TVYLGSPSVLLPNASELQRRLMEGAPEELHKVLQVMRTLPMIHIRRQMGNNGEYNPICNLYVSLADPKNARLAYMWGNTMRKPSRRSPGPEFIMIHIPEEQQLRQQILTIPEFGLNIALGTDYMGEDKKGFLRQAMYGADERGMLGLHAGTKIVTVRDAATDKLKKYGVFLFGLTATGKSTWSCHQLDLDHARGERTEVAQDDIVFLKKDGSAYGTEVGFYVKTDVDPKYQEAMYSALTDRTALLENVMIDADGTPSFLDERLCANGRAIVRRDKLTVKRGGKKVSIAYPSINLPPLDEMDGLVFAFITRRNSIMGFSQELTAEQAVLAYLWGESTHSFATQPDKAGESTRIVGTDDFIIGSRARKVNRFHEIVMGLVERYPGKVRFYQYNTGGVGELLETKEVDGKLQKRLIRKATRVPIDLMAAIQRGDLRESNTYKPGRLGTKEIINCEGKNLNDYDIAKLYTEEQIGQFVQDLVEGRRRFTEEIAREGLNPKILAYAEQSYESCGGHKRRLIPVDVETSEKTAVPEMRDLKPRSIFSEPKARPPRPFRSRFR